MSSDVPVDRKYAALVEICRASHFAWREAAIRCCPGVDPEKLVNEMWEITGVQTGEAYLKRLDPDASLPEQIGASIVWSSRCMGEDARFEKGSKEGECFVKHVACPWHRWHDTHGLLAEDRPGCDRWFESTLHTINEKLGANVRFETLSTLPDGDDCCRRRIWTDKGGAAGPGR